MQPLAAETHPEPPTLTSPDGVIQVVTDLYSELHHSVTERPRVGLQSRLEGDLGFDSLARVELLVRLERRFDVHLVAGQHHATSIQVRLSTRSGMMRFHDFTSRPASRLRSQ